MRLRNFILEFVVFVCGAVVMVYEIIGSRILSPFIGTSTYVWTSLIGVILAALSIGYWLGGRLADKRPSLRVLASVIFFAGGAVSVTILLKEIILSFVASANAGLEIKSLLAALLLFAPASVLLGFVTPYSVKLKIATLDTSGTTVGRLFAFSTVGSIAGTFLAGFFLIPFVGSVRTLYLLAATLIALSLIVAPFALNRLSLSILIVFIFGISTSELNAYLLRRSNDLHDIDTEYSRVQVFETNDTETSRRIRALAIDPYFIQSAIFLDSDVPVLHYSRFYHLIRYFAPGFENTLMIGGAGFTFPREYLRTYPSAKINVVEIDSRMTQIARDHFRLADDPRLRITHQDGRVYLNDATASHYDVVLVDAFGSLFTVPYQLTTIEAVRNIYRTLGDDGVVIVNLGSSISGPGSRFLAAEFATYKTVFPNALLFKVDLSYADDRLQNVIIVATKTPISPPSTTDPVITELLSHRYDYEPPGDTKILTDDLAPVEYYNSFAQDLFRRGR
jgi:spermidine synthase